MQRLQNVVLSLAVAVCLLGARSAAAQSTLIDFNSLSSLPCNSNFGGPGALFNGPSYSTNGFTFTSDGTSTGAFETWCSGGGGYTGTPALFAGQDFATITLTNGGLFSIQSIFLATLYSSFSTPLSVEFVGTRSDASQVSQKFTIPGGAVLTQFTFSNGFEELESLKWKQGNTTQHTSYQFDNLSVTTQSVTPEPATAALTATGLLALVAVRRARRRRRAMGLSRVVSQRSSLPETRAIARSPE